MINRASRILLLSMTIASAPVYSATLLDEDFESDTVGSNPVADYVNPGTATPTNFATVVDSGVNVAGSGNGVRLVDDANAPNVAARIGYDFSGGESAVRYDISLARLFAGSAGKSFSVCITENGAGPYSSGNRYAEVRVYDNGRVAYITGEGATGGQTATGYLEVGTAHTLSLVANDSDSVIANYQPGFSLAANSVDFWLDGTYWGTGTLRASLSDATTSGLGRVAVSSGSGDYALDYVFDDIMVSTVESAPRPEWNVATVTADAASLGNDFRRPMGAGLYDAAVGKTFICFTGAGMVPLVAEYDHASGAWGAPIAVTIPDTSTDAHDYSHIFMSADGHIHLTYSRHNQSLWISTSEHPHSIAGSWNTREIGSQLKATYPMPIKGSDGTIYILYRVTLSPQDYRPIKWVKSTDNGATWSAPVSSIDYNNSRSDHMNEIYLGQMSYEPAHPVFGEGYSTSWTLAGGGPLVHDHDDYHKNMYYAFFSMANAHWRAADGTDLGVNLDDSEAETYCLVYDSGALEGNRELGQTQDIGYTSAAACDANGNPVVAFQNGKDNSIDIGHWDGTNWNVHTPPTFEGTLSLRDMNRVNGTMWLLEDDGNGDRVVALNGTNWTDIAAYHTEENVDHSIFIDDARPEVMVFTGLDTEAIYSAGYPSASSALYADWIAMFPTLGTATDWSDDAELDGMDNLTEYALGADPTLYDTAVKRPITTIDSNWLYYIYNRRHDAAARGLSYTVLSGTDLMDGSMTNVVAPLSISDAVDGFESVTNRISTDTESTQFMGLKINLD